MLPRIEIAEVLTFRLKVPRQELNLLPTRLGPELGVTVAGEANELMVGIEDGESFLRFRSIGQEAVLTEIAIAQDDRGMFFQRVLGPLMVRFQGDLVIRLSWNTAERNSHGEYAEVKIARGVTTYPGLSDPPLALPPAEASPGQGAGETYPLTGGEDAEPGGPLTPEEEELDQLLTRAKTHWEEYQRLKGQKK